MDLFVVPTLGFDLLYAFVVIQLDRRELAWINVTANPTAEWVARQVGRLQQGRIAVYLMYSFFTLLALLYFVR